MHTMRGVVKWFDARKGYGFIVHPDGGPDIFVHYTQILQEEGFRLLRTGQRVEFELLPGQKGVHAHEVRVVEERPYGMGSGAASRVRRDVERPYAMSSAGPYRPGPEKPSA